MSVNNGYLPKPFLRFVRSQLVEGFLLLSEESFVVVFSVVFAFFVVMLPVGQFPVVYTSFRSTFFVDGFCANDEKTQRNAQCREKLSHFARIIDKQ